MNASKQIDLGMESMCASIWMRFTIFSEIDFIVKKLLTKLLYPYHWLTYSKASFWVKQVH